MNEKTAAIANQLLEHPNFRWMTGAHTDLGYIVVAVRGCVVDHAAYVDLGGVRGGLVITSDHAGVGRPDLDDPATVGCLMSLARELWRLPMLCVAAAWPDGFCVDHNDVSTALGGSIVEPNEGALLARVIMAAAARS